MKSSTISFQFKGTRNYVHGTDMYNAIVDILVHNKIYPSKINFTIHKRTDKQLTFLFKDKAEESILAQAIAIYKYRTKEGIQLILLMPTEQTVTDSYIYDEDSITINAIINKEAQSISLKASNAYSIIENIVASNKKLLNTLINPDNFVWVFSRIALTTNITDLDVQDIEISLSSNFQNSLFKSSILLNKAPVGDIYFSLTRST